MPLSLGILGGAAFAANNAGITQMIFSEIYNLVGHVPFISRANAQFLYDKILREKPKQILELGIAHGSATCFMAAAMQELGEGKITSVDLIETAEQYQPAANEQLAATGLSSFVEIVRMKTGYTWFLHDKIRQNTRDDICTPEYDLCVIDGPKNWTIDGAAFFMADKLLKPGGWFIFDDYSWTYGAADDRRDSTDGITHRALSEAERQIPHIREVFELLVVQHPDYSNFLRLTESDWALAQKVLSDEKKYTIIRNYADTHRDVVSRIFHKTRHLIRAR